jgi:hypothetical protein
LLIDEAVQHVPRKDVLAVIDTASSQQQFERRIVQALVSKWDAESVARLAGRLIDETSSIVWIELAESLVEEGRCAFDHFGRFELRDEAQVSVWFRAATTFGNFAPPEKIRTENPELDLALDVCDTDFRGTLDQWTLDLEVKSEAEATEASRQLLTQHLEGIFAGVEELLPGDEDPTFQPFAAHALATAYASYYSYLMGCAYALDTDRDLRIPLIGRFTKDLDVVSFEAGPNFVRFLSSNLPLFA